MKVLTGEQLKKVIDARRALHLLAEPSNHEFRTKQFLMDFIAANTNLEIYDMNKWFYAVHNEQNAKKTIVIRADFDAVTLDDGQCKHLCGHDGHSATLLGVALLLNEGYVTGSNVVLLFQHAEETGDGAAECAKLLVRQSADEVIGYHNIPGFEMGTVLLRHNTFACASCGAVITLEGSPSHAAYPENGKNPAFALARLVNELPGIASRASKQCAAMTLATIVGINCGGEHFGVAASEGRLSVTLRSENDIALNALICEVEKAARDAAHFYELKYGVEYRDAFPATVNHPDCVSKLIEVCKENAIAFKLLSEPFRWSEDFGHYTKHTACVMFGIGAGEGTTPLHTANYEYPDALLDKAVNVLMSYVTHNP